MKSGSGSKESVSPGVILCLAGRRGNKMARLQSRCLLFGLSLLFLALPGRTDDKPKEDGSKPPATSSGDPRVNIEPRLRTPKTPEPDGSDRRSNIRIDTTLVLIPVSVTDPMNRFVTGLEREHFRLFED